MSKPSLLRIVSVAADVRPAESGALDEASAHEQAEHSRRLRIGLLQNGHNIVAVLPADIHLPDRVSQIARDMIIVEVQSQAHDTLEHVVLASRDARRRIVLFSPTRATPATSALRSPPSSRPTWWPASRPNVHYRKEVLDFLYTHHGQPQK
ncbi:MAG: hypothetical protein ABIX46_13235, partial [Burkholderiaceae bacterium]